MWDQVWTDAAIDHNTLSDNFKEFFHIETLVFFSSTTCTAWNQLFADLAIRGDEAGDAHQAGVGKQLGHFRNTPDVFFPVFGGEAQVFVQSVANVVSVQGVTRDGVWHEVLFQGKADGGLPGARQA